MSDEFEKQLQQHIAQLQKDKLPERDLWPGVEMAVIARKHRHTSWMAVAASLVACAISGWLLVSRYYDVNTQTSAVISQIDALHQQEITALKVSFKNTQPLTTDWNDQLHGMDRAADAIKNALKNDPGNITLLKMLTDVYQKEIDLLKRVHEPNLQNPEII